MGYVYIDNGVFLKTNNQQQNVMLIGTDPHHDFIHDKIEEKIGPQHQN